MSEADVADLVVSRGYVKGAITRLYNALCDKEAKLVLTVTELKTRRERAVGSFAEYEALNKQILSLKPADTEDVEVTENKFYKVISILDERIARETPPPLQSTLPTGTSKFLPRIELPVFAGKYSDYVTFIELFKSIIHNDTAMDTVQKLHYLRSYLRGEAFDLIKNLPLTQGSYYEAMDLLQGRYYNKYKIKNEHIDTLLDIKPINSTSSSQIREFVSTIKQTLAALKNLGANVTEWAPLLINIFNRKIDAATARAYHLDRDADEEADTEGFLKFLERRALAFENSEPASSASKPSSKAVNAVATDNKQACRFCKCLHKIYLCERFKMQPISQRIKFAKENNLCSSCLNSHPGKCRFFFKCGTCKSPKHHTLLHTEMEPKQRPLVMFAGNDTTDDDDAEENVLLPTVRVKLFSRDNREVHVKAVLDSCSQKSLVSQKLVDVLGLTPKISGTNLIGVGNSRKAVKYSVPLEIYSLNSTFSRSLNCGVVDEVTCHLPQDKIDRSQLQIPPDMTLADEQFDIPSEINMLIGANVFFQSLLVLPWPVVQSKPVSGPSTSQPKHGKERCLRIVNTEFGHIIGGDLPDQNEATAVQLVGFADAAGSAGYGCCIYLRVVKPSDYVSRGLDPHELADCAMWWKGPIFLQNREYSFDDQSVQLPDDLPELQAASASSKGVVLSRRKRSNF
ncbi:putative peptidase (DUF1758) domain-containing protein [Phthorimaea operculella]|nr:putative peptidase (DUF1758) domain-containing protein [Phthorimaea operculella]